MLSKNTHNLFSLVLRASHRLKPAYFAPIPSLVQTPSLARTPYYPKSLHSFSKVMFSASSNNESDPNNNSKPTDPANKDKDKSSEASNTAKANSAKKVEKTEKLSSPTNEKLDEKKLRTVPLRPTRLPPQPGDENLKVETFVLFSSGTPIIPYSHQSGHIRTGNLDANHISNKLAFFIQNELGEIYTVGLVLEDRVNKTLKKNLGGSASPGVVEEQNKHKAEITTKSKDYKIRLTEVEFKDNCVFVKGVPYRDSKMTEEEKKVNVPKVLGQIKELIAYIRELVSVEKMEVFNNISLELPSDKKLEHRRLDEILCNILGEYYKLASYTKESSNVFIETFLEERSLIQRMFMIKKKLEEVKNIIEIINRSLKYSEDGVWKSQDNAKARLSFEYIRSNYFVGESGPGGAGAGKGAGAGGTQTGNPNITGPAKKFMEKLHLIKDEASREKVRKEIERFAIQDKMSGEYHKLYTYLDDVFSIPWDKFSEEYWDIEYSHKVLEKQLFGLDKVKERIIEMIAVNKLKRVDNNNIVLPPSEKRKGFVILLNGPPGTGKTTIAKAIATALKRESRFISFAGVTDPAFVKGHKRTYLDAQPGVFVKELTKAKVMNPVFILDEVDKLSKHHQGVDPYYALMEILNPEENQNFTDHYLDIKVDFSNVIFILTSNQVLNMLEPLRNRLEIIEVPSYIEQDKLLIAKNYLLPGVLSENGLTPQNIVFDDETLRRIIKGWCYYESGVRDLRRCIEKIARKHALEIIDTHSPEAGQPGTQAKENTQTADSTTSTTEAPKSTGANTEKPLESQKIDFQARVPKIETSLSEDKDAEEKLKDESKASGSKEPNKEEVAQILELRDQRKLVFDAEKDPNDELLKKYLGLPVFDDMYERKNKKVHTGTVNVLTVSGFVGHVLSVECVYDITNPDKKGQITCSGNLQKVLQESLTIARLVALKFLPQEKIKEISEKNIHVHFLQGGTPKDGPSAGLSICSALLSVALEKPIDPGVSMTGELSLNGEVYKIGGVQAKVTASKALDIKKIILPWGNKTDFFELPQMLKEDLEVYFVKEYREVYEILFGNSPKELETIEKFSNGKLIPAMPRQDDISLSINRS